MEASWVIGQNSLLFLRALGILLAQESNEERSTSYLLSVAVQQGNEVAILGCSAS